VVIAMHDSGISNFDVVVGGQTRWLNDLALYGPAVHNGDYYRLLTNSLVHYGILHIAFNMWALLVIGTPLEQMLGRMRFLALYFLSGLGGSLLSFALGPVGEVAAGASGAIFGLFGAFYVVSRHRGLETGQIVGLIAINLVISFTFSGIDWRGHVGGLIVGGAVAFVLARAPHGPMRDRFQALGCAGIAVVLAAAGFVASRHVDKRCDDLLDVFRQQGQVTVEQAQGLQSCVEAGLVA
jgi:membrane associated rhomboid family serine protease